MERQRETEIKRDEDTKIQRPGEMERRRDRDTDVEEGEKETEKLREGHWDKGRGRVG